MKMFIAGPNRLSSKEELFKQICLQYKPYILESFYYMTDTVINNLSLYSDFLLDSGAFTFIHNSKDVDYKKYTDKYIEFINKYDIKHFFEMDIDNVIGYNGVLQLRKEIENQTGKKTIPVFHKSRGLKEWHKMSEEYDYIAIGTIGEYKNNFAVMQELVKIAGKYKTKVHGLGYTALSKLKYTGFYSVDSTSWSCGNRFGMINYFDGETLKKAVRTKGKRVKTHETLINNLNEWLKFQKYVDMAYKSEVS